MLATILKGPVTTQTTIEIIETFARIREFGRNAKQLSISKTENEKQPLWGICVLGQDSFAPNPGIRKDGAEGPGLPKNIPHLWAFCRHTLMP
jgi:hypothetical protein